MRGAVDALFARLSIERASFDSRRYFCLLFIDGLSGAEERVTPLVAEALDGVLLVGGSAGDDLAFVRTEVIHGGRAASGAAVVALCESDVAFQLLSTRTSSRPHSARAHQADSSTRGRLEHDGEPAAQVYARSLGVPREALTDALTFEHPLTFRSSTPCPHPATG